MAWFPDARREQVKDVLAAPVAPEIVFEVHSPSNTGEELAHRRRLYVEAGAEEVWTCDEDGHIRVYDHGGERKESRRVPSFPVQIEV